MKDKPLTGSLPEGWLDDGTRGSPERTVSIPVGSSLANAERELILATLEECRGNKTRAAVMLGISLKTLYNRLNVYSAEAERLRA
jgi:DNA-binding NtrC family response regulator